MKTFTQISNLLSDIVELGVSGTRSEWIDLFSRTQVTNAPGLLFSDALGHQVLVEEEIGCFKFVEAIHAVSNKPDSISTEGGANG